MEEMEVLVAVRLEVPARRRLLEVVLSLAKVIRAEII
jgi:hypothetical protein